MMETLQRLLPPRTSKAVKLLYRATQEPWRHSVKRLYYKWNKRSVDKRWKMYCAHRIGCVESVLDLGPGIHPCGWIPCMRYQAIEPHGEYRAVLRRKGIEALPFTVQEWMEKGAEITTQRTHSVIIIRDIIEHLEKKEGIELLDVCQRRAEWILLTTPTGFYPQPELGERDTWGYHGQEWQRHRSGWLPEEFRSQDGWETVTDPDFNSSPTERFGAFLAIWERKRA